MRCVIDGQREAEREQVCDACRTRQVAQLRDLLDAYAALGVTDPAEPADLLVLDDGTFDGPRVYDVLPLPAGPVRAPNGSARVSGSRDAPVPVSLDLVDLTLPARPGSRAPHARGVLGYDDDQIGWLSVATELDTWVRDWRTYPRCPGTVAPEPTVTAMVRWFVGRLDWACDEHPAVDEFAGDVRRLLAACRRVVGDVEQRPEYLDGVPCSGCDLMALYRERGSKYRAECGGCGKLYTDEEYERWIGMMAAQVRAA